MQFKCRSAYYIVQEYIDGQNLKQELLDGGAFHEEKIWQILEELLPLLHRIHQVEVIHRDIKPDNIIRRRHDRRLVVVDFGAVKVATQTALAKTGTSIGSAEFSAPEQIKGKPVFASDLYALGVSCIYLMTQVSPFDLYSDREGCWVWRDFLPRDNRISPRLGKILDQLIALPLGQRFETAPGVLTAIHPPAPPPEPPKPEPAKPYRAPEPRPPIKINPTPAQPLAKPTDRRLAPRSGGMGRRVFLGLGVMTFAGVIARSLLKNVTTPPTPHPECGNLSTEILNPNLVAGLRTESYSFKTVVNIKASGTGGQELTQQITRWIEDLGNGVLLHLVRIPAGKFMMGSPNSEDLDGDESPQHEVYIPECWMGQFEVTQAQYQRITNENPATQYAPTLVDPQKPIINLTWENAAKFCQGLSSATGRTYRLPTEAEWEYACRACTTTPFHFGETITPDLVNYDSDAQQTTPVGSFPPNAWGLYDMHGNVWEWCADQYYYENKPEGYENKPEVFKQDGSIAWIQANTNLLPSELDHHRLRGGSWRNRVADGTRSAKRYGLDAWYNDVGFRVLLSSRIP